MVPGMRQTPPRRSAPLSLRPGWTQAAQNAAILPVLILFFVSSAAR